MEYQIPTPFSVFLRQLLGDFESSKIDEKTLQSKITDYLVKESPRPRVSGDVLKELDTWVSAELRVHKSTYGELVADLYANYVSFHQDPNTLISRKNFPNALLYVLKKVKNSAHPEFIPGRKAQITGIELKHSKS